LPHRTIRKSPAETPARAVEILLVEDSPTDVMITREAMLEAKLINNLHVVENGEDALAYVNRRPPFADAPRPDLILLDLNIPRKPGLEVLAEIKQDPRLRSIPVVVLTTSNADEDVLAAYGHHANCFITKPVDFEALCQVLHHVEEFWMCIVTLPPGRS